MKKEKEQTTDELELNIGALLNRVPADLEMPEAEKISVLSALLAEAELIRRKQPNGKRRREMKMKRVSIVATGLAAAALITAALLWLLSAPQGIAWADVVRNLNLRLAGPMSFTVTMEHRDENGKSSWAVSREYRKSLSISRRETYADLAAMKPPEDLSSLKIERIGIGMGWESVSKTEYRGHSLTIYPAQKFGVKLTDILRGPATIQWMKNNRREGDKYLDRYWDFIQRTTADQTRRIGERILNGVKVTGFEAPLSSLMNATRPSQRANDSSKGIVRIWVDIDTGLPFQIESEHDNGWIRTSEIRFNPQLPDSLFDERSCAGYQMVEQQRVECKLEKATFKPGVSFTIATPGKAPLVTTSDVIEVPWMHSRPGYVDSVQEISSAPQVVEMELKLKKEAGKRLLNCIGTTDPKSNPCVWLDLNGEFRIQICNRNLYILDKFGSGSDIEFDVASTGLTMEQFMERYLQIPNQKK
jgi:hypothetical protein